MAGIEAGDALFVSWCAALSLGLAACGQQAGDGYLISQDGDHGLQYETLGASLVGTAAGIDAVYMADPVPPGSYAAWAFGAPDGFAPGYHLFRPRSLEEVAQMKACSADLWPLALAEIKARYEARIQAEYGPSSTLATWPLLSHTRSATPERVPDDVFEGGSAIIALLEMERCPMPNRIEVDGAARSRHQPSWEATGGPNAVSPR